MLVERIVIRPHIAKFIHGGYPIMTEECKKYNSLKNLFDKNCNVMLDNNANGFQKCFGRSFKYIL